MEDITKTATKLVFLNFPCRVVVCESGDTYGSTDPETNDLREYARIIPKTKACGGIWITQFEFAGKIEWSKHAGMLTNEQRAHAPKFAAKGTKRNANRLCRQIQRLCKCTPQEAVKTLIAAFDEALKIRENKH